MPANPISLVCLGWSAREAGAFAPFAARGLEPGRVTREHTHVYTVQTASAELLARVVGRLRHQAAGPQDFPAVGDWVAVDARAAHGRATIHAVLPRRSCFLRKVAGSRTVEQVVAANVDTVFLVAGLDGDFNLRRLERYAILARESEAEAVVVLNKVDMCEDPAAAAAEVARLTPPVPVAVVSGLTGQGLDALMVHLRPGRTVAFLGSSGAGKSTIINALVGAPLLPTREVRARDRRGQHASTNRQLVLVPGGGLVIDTPGMRELQLWDVTEGLAETFGDVEALGGGCHFRDCGHRGEPGCAVQAAVDKGRLPADRLEHFRKLRDELAHLARKQDERARLEHKRRGRAIALAARRHKPRG